MRIRFSAVLFASCLPLAAILSSTNLASAQTITDKQRADAKRLIDAALADSSAWGRLADLTDTFGSRLSGSKALEDAIDWVLAEMRRDGLDNVSGA